MGIVLNSFARKWLLGEPCAYLARPQSRVSFWLRIFSCPIFVEFPIPLVCILIWVCASVRLLIRINMYTYIYICIYVYIYTILRICIFLASPIYTLYIHACVWQGSMDYGVNFGPEICAFLARSLRARIWAEHVSLWQVWYIIVVNFHFCLPTGGREHSNCMRLPVHKQNRCRIATSIQKHVEETTWHATTQIPLRKKPWASLVRNFKFSTNPLTKLEEERFTMTPVCPTAKQTKIVNPNSLQPILALLQSTQISVAENPGFTWFTPPFSWLDAPLSLNQVKSLL